MIDLRNQDFVFLGKGSKIEGNFFFEGESFIESHIVGEIKMTSTESLTIGRNGIIDGQIECSDIEIYGKVDGSIEAKGRVVVHPSGQVHGEIKTSALVIRPGGIVNMSCDAEELH